MFGTEVATTDPKFYNSAPGMADNAEKSCGEAQYKPNLGEFSTLRMKIKDSEPKAPTPRKSENYKSITKEVFHGYQRLIKDSDQWVKEIDDKWAIKMALNFNRGSKIEWSDDLASIALEYENDNAPCSNNI